MSVPWNPSIPVIEGLEWNATRSGFEPLDGVGDCVAQTLRSTVTETITSIQVYANTVPTPNGVIMEVFQVGSEVSTGNTAPGFNPNGQANVGAGVTSVPCAPNHFNCLDGTTGTVFAPTGQGLDVQYGTGAFTGRVLGISFIIRIVGTGTTNVSLVRVSDGAAINLGDYAASGIGTTAINVDVPITNVTVGEINPFTSQPWTQVEARGFDGSLYRLRLLATTSADYQGWRQARLTISACNENRLARNHVVPTGPSTGWVTFPATSPTGAANWAKAAGVDYTIVFRHPVGGFVTSGGASRFAPAWFDSGVTPPYGKSAWAPTITASIAGIAFNVGAISTLGVALTRGYAVAPIIVTSLNASVDSQPYAGPFASGVNLFAGIIQEITVSGGPTTVGAVSLVMRPTGINPVPDVPLVGTLRNNTGGTTHATYEVTLGDWQRAPTVSADVNAQGIPWKRVVVPLSTTVALTNLTQYRVYANSFAPFGIAGENAWEVLALSIGGLSNLGVNATFNGNVDGGWVGGAKTTGDYPITLLQLGPAVTGAIAEPKFVAAGGSGAEYPEDTFTICGEAPGVMGIPYAEVAWSPTAVAGSPFAHYEVQRLDPRVGDWQVVAWIAAGPTLGSSAEGASALQDREAGLNTLTSYRVRAVQQNGQIGPWSTTVSTTLLVEASSGGTIPLGFYTFTSNQDPSLSLLYIDAYEGAEASREYEVLDAAQTSYDALYKRDYWHEQRNSELRGVRFTRTLLVSAVQLPLVNKRGIDKFAAIRRLQTQQTAPYVCVRASNGERFFASVLVPSVRERQPSNLYFASVQVTELTATPTPVAAGL